MPKNSPYSAVLCILVWLTVLGFTSYRAYENFTGEMSHIRFDVEVGAME